MQGFEICLMFKMKPAPANEDDTATLDRLYNEYERRILFKLNGIEGVRHDKRCKNLPPNSKWCNCRTRQDEIHEWEDWALANFGRDEKDIDWAIPKYVLERIGLTTKEIERFRVETDYEKTVAGKRSGAGVP